MARPYLHSLIHVSKKRARQIGGTAFVLLFALTLLAWQAAQNHKKHDMDTIANLTADQIAKRIELFLLQHIRALDRQALQWLEGAPQDERDYVSRTTPLLDVYPTFQALNWVSPDRIISYVAPIQGNLAALGADLGRHPIASKFLDSVIGTGTLRATRPLDLLQGGRGVAVYQPVRARNGDIIGLLNGVFRISSIISEINLVSRSEAFGYRLQDGDAMLYESENNLLDAPVQGSAQITFADRTWTLIIVPNAEWIADQHTLYPNFVLVGGMILTFIVSGLLFLSLNVRAHTGLMPTDLSVETQHGAIIIERDTGTILEISEAAAAIIGLPPVELRGTAFGDVCPELMPNGSTAEGRIKTLLNITAPNDWDDWALHGGNGLVATCGIRVDAVTPSQLTVLIRRSPSLHGPHNRSRDLATHDPLTGLPNQALVLDRLAQSIASARRRQESVAMLIVEIQEPAIEAEGGDLLEPDVMSLLRSISSRLRGGLREMDTLGRLEGTRFAIIAKGIDVMDGVNQLALRLYDGFNIPVDRGGQNVTVKTAIGIAVYPSDTRSAEQLLSNAGSALQRAKLNAPLPIGYFSRTQTEAMQTQHRETQALQEAIHTSDLELVWLQRRRLNDGCATGHELGVRWTRPSGRVIEGDALLSLAEKGGISAELMAWMIREAHHHCAKGEDGAEHATLPVSIRLNAAQLADETIFEALTLPPMEEDSSGATFEVDLEPGIFDQLNDYGTKHLTQLSHNGISLNVINFCQGMCHPKHLTHYDIRHMKFAPAAVTEALQNPRQAILIQALTRMATQLKITTVVIDVMEDVDLSLYVGLGFDAFQLASNQSVSVQVQPSYEI